MNDRVDARHRFSDRIGIADVAFDDLGVRPVEIVAATAREVVERAYFYPPAVQLRDEVRPDETAGTGDESSSGNR
jgi:hypothetical protein